ncbi:MAG: hypothetical protein B7X12_07735 [Halothiobacillus sp. 20-53-49]|nr:MAG: hypothetical protein B7X12_07735 [Halothiobacillus sp. 20-53-49]
MLKIFWGINELIVIAKKMGVCLMPHTVCVGVGAIFYEGTSKNLLRHPIAASRARSRLAYLLDMSRCSLRGWPRSIDHSSA